MKRKMIREYLKTSFSAVFFTLLFGTLISYLIFFNRAADETMPQYLVADIQNFITFQNQEFKISQTGLEKLKKHDCWLQMIDSQGNVVGSANVDKKLPGHYSPYELVQYTLNSEQLNKDTLFVNAISNRPGYGVILGCDSKYVQKHSILLFGSHIFPKVCLVFLVIMAWMVYMESWFFSKKITTPIMRIMEDIPKIAKGKELAPLERGSVFSGVSRQLAELQARLQENKRMRAEWISNISHDMKTPLSTIRGYSELLGDASYQFEPDEVREYAREIVKSERYIENLIQDLRLSQKLVEGKVPLQREEVELAPLLQECTERIDRMQNKREAISVDCEMGIRLFCDRNLMERCLINIISNAFIHNPDGVQVIVRAKTDQDRICIEIQDNGKGMDERDTRHIFERYYHGTNAQQRGGTGLGLAIAKETIEAHGGTIFVESKKEIGTKFVISLENETLI